MERKSRVRLRRRERLMGRKRSAPVPSPFSEYQFRTPYVLVGAP